MNLMVMSWSQISWPANKQFIFFKSCVVLLEFNWISFDIDNLSLIFFDQKMCFASKEAGKVQS